MTLMDRSVCQALGCKEAGQWQLNGIPYCAEHLPRAAMGDPRKNETQPQPFGYSHERWEGLLRRSIETIGSLSTQKGGEYAGSDDRLANFRRNAAQTGVSMETVWSIYYNKHHDAVMQYVRDKQHGKTRPRAEPIAGRIDDMLVYLLLFKAILEETQT